MATWYGKIVGDSTKNPPIAFDLYDTGFVLTITKLHKNKTTTILSSMFELSAGKSTERK